MEKGMVTDIHGGFKGVLPNQEARATDRHDGFGHELFHMQTGIVTGAIADRQIYIINRKIHHIHICRQPNLNVAMAVVKGVKPRHQPF